MTAVDDVARMLTLVPWLLERPGASLTETADAFGVTPDRLRRDLYHLDFCGLPGLGGGALFDVAIVDDRIVVEMADELRRPLRLTAREALRLVLTVDTVAETFGDALPALRRAASKLHQATNVPQSVAVELATEGGRWLAPLQQAVASRRQVRLRYRGRGDPTPVCRTVDPWVVRIAEGAIYLQGHDHRADALRSFRLDRIADVEVLAEPAAVGAPSGPLPPPRYVPGPDDVEVELLVGPGARWIADAVETDRMEQVADDRWRVVFHTDVEPWAERLVLMGGGEVTVVSPPDLAHRVRDRARRALARYDATD